MAPYEEEADKRRRWFELQNKKELTVEESLELNSLNVQFSNTPISLEEQMGIYLPSNDIEEGEKMKEDKGKAPMNLLPFEALEEISYVLGFGAKKYSERGWYEKCETIEDFKRYEASLIRHISKWLQGNEYDEETELHELAHLACNALFLLSLKNKFRPEVGTLQEKRRLTGGMI